MGEAIGPQRGRQDGDQAVVLAVTIVAQSLNRSIGQRPWLRPGGQRDLAQQRSNSGVANCMKRQASASPSVWSAGAIGTLIAQSWLSKLVTRGLRFCQFTKLRARALCGVRDYAE